MAPLHFANIGSPPRAWGRLALGLLDIIVHRFTPTCVGKTALSPLRFLSVSVHPHVRGEDARHGAGARSRDDGSPPRAWGRRCLHAPRHVSVRFTPTCVGKTHYKHFCPKLVPVHPHVRGEDTNIWCEYLVGNHTRCMRFIGYSISKEPFEVHQAGAILSKPKP